MATPSSLPSLQGSTIVVRPYIDSQPTRCCTKCRKDFPETSAYFKAFKKGGFAATCVDCTSRYSAAKKATERSAQGFVSTETRGRKRRVLGETGPNVQRKAPRLAPKVPARWDMASQRTKEQMRSKAASERQNRYRRNNNLPPISSRSPDADPSTVSSVLFPSQTPPHPTSTPAPGNAPISDGDWTNINTFHEYLSNQKMETCARCKERWFQMGLSNGVCGACSRRDRNLPGGVPFLFSKDNNMDPGVVPECLRALTQMEETVIAKAHCHMIVKRVRGHQYHYTGHAVCFWQSNVTFIDALPSRPEHVDIVLLRPHGARMDEERYKRQFRNDFRVRRGYVQKALHWLKRYHPDYRDITISQPNLLALPVDGDVSDHVLNIEESEEMKDTEPGRQGDSRACGEEDERGIDGNIPGPSQETVVPNLDILQTEAELLEEAFKKRRKLPTAQAPAIRQTPIDELGRKHRLFAMCFPTLFPYGTADWHQGRMRNVSLADWAEHFLKFHDGRFGAHPRFRFLVFNMLMRKKAREASGFWVKKRPDLLGLSLDELKELLGEESTLLKSIVRSGATLTGTRPYWRQKENALKATARYFGTTGTVFCTWSCADHQWDDLHRHLPRYVQWRDGTDEDRRKIAWENVQRFPHIIAAWLDIRFKAFLKYVMTSFLGLDDYWFRYEWQARGTGHIHCIIWMRDSPAMGARTPEQREAFAQYWNKKVTAVNPNPNSTRPADARNPASLPFIHICNTDEQVAIFMNRFQMHARCAPGRCLRKNKTTDVVECRFFFPRELQERALVTKSINKKSWMFGVERNVERLAQCSPVMALGWLANTDLQPAVTYKGLILYVAKYVSKPEIRSASYQELQEQILPYVSDRRPIASFAARLLNKLIGECDGTKRDGLLAKNT
ncbi:ATP-dependent DNA helicase PIF1 [Metarhizium guizhouense ARSEF 977]|uniref:ATP-dependent DNA helicase PIF1 n=1 Tax=Metarhizium guizhouense (strain ARSEF 977) TaxID=1276136 RepID=A0A0B4GMB4_METGA|nr:ATP-dependent DNA helicase PIF1 [Metarhizium guizhouense ARSEF 977]